MSDPKQLPAAIYVRISRDAEDTGLGVERQRQDCQRLADVNGWDVVQVYKDNDTSATNGKARPAYQRMVREIEAGRIKGILVWDVDRLTRTPRELEDVIDWADKHGLHLASVGGEIDLSTPQGRMTARIKGTVARHETDQLSRRSKRKQRELAEAGVHIGPRPFGWDFTGGRRLAINPAEAAIVREGIRRVLAGEALWSIVNDLTARSVTTTRGNQWQTQTFRTMLLRWRNCGIRSHKGKPLGPGAWDPIIDRETHDRVTAYLTNPARRTNNRGTAPKYLLTSIAECGECGSYVVGVKEHVYDVKITPRSGHREPYIKTRVYPANYKCPVAGCMKVSRRMDTMDAHVTETVLRYLERNGVEALGGDPAAEESARERVGALEAKLALAADQWAADQITGDQLQRITGRLRPELEAEQARHRRALPADDSLAAFTGATARQAWDQATLEQRKHVLRILRDDTGMRIRVVQMGPNKAHIGVDADGVPMLNPDGVPITWDGATTEVSA